MFKMKSLAFCMAVVLTTASCQTTGQEQGQMGGLVLGGLLGGLVGNKAGGGKGAIVGAVLGAVAGSYLGSEIGKHLDEKDREVASKNTKDTLAQTVGAKGETVTRKWTSPDNEGVSGQTTASLSDISGCYEVVEMATIPGTGEVRQSSRYCQNEEGQLLKV